MEINKDNLSNCITKNNEGMLILQQDAIFDIFYKCVIGSDAFEFVPEGLEEVEVQLLEAIKITMIDLKKRLNENEKFSDLKTIDVEQLIKDRTISADEYPNAHVVEVVDTQELNEQADGDK